MFDKEDRVLLPPGLDHVPQAFANSFRCRRSDKTVLLHGVLRIGILRAHHLRDTDCGLLTCQRNVSDPYVTVYAGSSRLVKTAHQANDLDPVWNEEHTVFICHYVRHLELHVKDLDKCGVGRLGRVSVPLSDILKFDSQGRELRTGVHRIDYLDGKRRHGKLEYFIEYVPSALLQSTLEVPGTYFQSTTNNDVRFYITADMDPQNMPTIDKDSDAGVQRCWKDIYESISQAKEMVYIIGWSVDYTISLLRGNYFEKATNESKYSPYIGELLKQKAAEGVTVNMLVWDDQTSNKLNKEGFMGTGDEKLREFFKNTEVNCELISMGPLEVDVKCCSNVRNAFFYTHHQKVVICDQPDKTLVAYLGGIDLTKGRWDDGSYSLFRTLQSKHKNDFKQSCLDGAHQSVGPRMPWHDIHMRLQGPGVVPLLTNFEERWKSQASQKVQKLVAWKDHGLSAQAVQGDICWNTQAFRSIDSRSAVLSHCGENENKVSRSFTDSRGVKFDEPIEEKRHRFQKYSPIYKQTFSSTDGSGFEWLRHSQSHSGRDVDRSCQAALIHHIRRAEHVIYMESQYFLSSAFLWRRHKSSTCRNQVAAEIVAKICQKIEAGERFAVYIVIPMWPSGVPESTKVQEILRWQHLTMESMYMEIARCIKKKKLFMKQAGKEFDANPQDYLNFYCLGTRETTEGSQATSTPKRNSTEARVTKTRRFLVYVHSKLCIVDDEVSIIGSANINERSLAGTRDTEISNASWEQNNLSSKDSIARGSVHRFRLRCWAHLTGQLDPLFRDPSSLACVRRLNEIAQKNWDLFSQDAACEMKSSLLPYPIQVNEAGKLRGLTKNGRFLDTHARISGKLSIIPSLLTT